MFLRLAIFAGLVYFPAAARAGESGARRQSAMREYQCLDTATRSEWVRALMQERLLPAARVYLASPELETEEQFMAGVIERAYAGRKLSDAGLRQLLDLVDEHEHAAIEYLARAYRIAVFQAFRNQRAEFDRRLAAWQIVYGDWQAAGELSDDNSKLIRWLQAATSRMRSGQLALLPALPKFGEASAKQLVRSNSPPPAPNLAHDPAATPSVSASGARVVRQPPKVASPFPAFSAVGSNAPRVDPAIANPNKSAAQSIPQIASAKVLPRIPPSAVGLNDSVEVPAEILVTPAPANSEIASHGTSTAHASQSSGEILRADANTVRIDLAEMSARIAGHNLALAALVDRLHDKKLWTPAQLLQGLDELSDLNRRGADLKLYWYILAASDRAGVGKLNSSDTAVVLLAEKIVANRNQLMEGIYEGTLDEKRAELAELEMLSQRLARMVSTAKRIEEDVQ